MHNWNYPLFIFVARSLWLLADVVPWYNREFSSMGLYLYGIHTYPIVFFNFCNLPCTMRLCSHVINLFCLCLKHVFVINKSWFVHKFMRCCPFGFFLHRWNSLMSVFSPVSLLKSPAARTIEYLSFIWFSNLFRSL